MKTMICTPENAAQFNAELRAVEGAHDFAKALHAAGLIDGLRGARLQPAGAPQRPGEVAVQPVLRFESERRIADLWWQREQAAKAGR